MHKHDTGRGKNRCGSEDSFHWALCKAHHTWQPYRSLTNDFTINVGDTFQMAPDHHASATFTLTGIEDNGIVIRYESYFDHRSFGKDLITKDVVEFRWPYIKEK